MNDTLVLRTSGVIKFIINDKKRDSSLFTYNTGKEMKIQMLKNLREKIEEFMAWYADFQNVDAIEKFELYTSDAVCTSGCAIPIGTSFSVIGRLYTPQEVQKILNDAAAKYKIDVRVNVSDY